MAQLAEVNPITGRTSAKARKGAAELKKLVQCGELSPHDVDFIIAATDAFHDRDLPDLLGAPDGQRAKSLVNDVTKLVEIGQPAGFTEPTWGVMMTVQPVLTSVPMGKRGLFGTTMFRDDNGPHTIGSLNFTFVDGNGDFDDTYFQIPVPPLCPDLDFLQGPVQVLGMCFEVENTTAPLYKQGALHTAIMNQNPPQTTTLKFVTDEPVSPATEWLTTNCPVGNYFECRKPPKNPGELSLLPGNQTWKAEDGMYAVVREQYNQFVCNNTLPTYPLLTDQDFPPGVLANTLPNDGEITVYSPLHATHMHDWPGEGGVTESQEIPYNVVRNPCHMSIAQFVGLSPQTTLTVRARWLIQRFPSEQNPSIINLAKSPPPRCDLAFEIVDKILSQMPPAVMFAENDSGGWWQSVLETIGDLAPIVGMIPHPIAQGVSAGMKVVGSKKSEKSKDQTIEELNRMINELKKELDRRTMQSTHLKENNKVLKQQVSQVSAKITAVKLGPQKSNNTKTPPPTKVKQPLGSPPRVATKALTRK